MAKLLTTLFTFLWLVNDSQGFQCDQRVTSIYGKKLVKHTYNTIKVGSLSDCLLSCAHEFSDKCRSTNWHSTHNCELNNAKYEDFLQDLESVDDWIYMTSIAIATGVNREDNQLPTATSPTVMTTAQSLIDETTTIPSGEITTASPVGGHEKSCQTIKSNGKSKGDGEYSIDPENTGTPITVYCDMTTDGGGWILIKNRTLTTPVQSMVSEESSNNYKDISKTSQLNFYLNTNALKALSTAIGAKQLRWFCTKKRDGGRKFHIMTNMNVGGTQAFKFFTDSTIASLPTACDSFETLPDNNAILSQNCRSWGKDGNNLRVDKWSWDSVKTAIRAYKMVARWENNYAFSMGINDYTCDDVVTSSSSTINDGDRWLVFMR